MAPIEMTEELCTKPIQSFEELMEFNLKDVKVKKGDRINTAYGKMKRKLDGESRDAALCPKLLVCHDFKGGYGDDRFCDGSSNPENYYFRHWLQTDIFVYFAHKFVTIPPLGWINAAHSNGVTILGTIITEWKEGVSICESILKDSITIDKCVEKLCAVNNAYGFDGYLLNIENKIAEKDIPNLLEFIQKLTKELKFRSSINTVIWYDSVVKNGELKWQDELNEQNKIFFDACDGIYLNYNWNDEKLKNSLLLAKPERKFDVYVGVDVFGRGCFGGGGFNTSLAVEKIASFDMSMAIFAPAWTFELHSYDKFSISDDLLWNLCSMHFYFKSYTIKSNDKVHDENEEGEANDSLNFLPNCFERIFQTDFSCGYGEKFYLYGKAMDIKWFNLSHLSNQAFIKTHDSIFIGQSMPLSSSPPSTGPQIELKDFKIKEFATFQTNCGFLSGGSLNVYKDKTEQLILWIPIELTQERLITLGLFIIWKPDTLDFVPNFFIEKKNRDSTEKIYFDRKDGLFELPFTLTASVPESLVRSKLGNLMNLKSKQQFKFSEFNGWQCIFLEASIIYMKKDEELISLKLHSSPNHQFSLGHLSLYKFTID